MGGKSGDSQTQTSEPWAAQKPYLEGGFQQAADLYNLGPQLPALSNNTTDAWNMIQNRAKAGSELSTLGNTALRVQVGNGAGTSALSGFAQGGNPFQQALANQTVGGNPGAATYAGLQGRNFGTDAIAGKLDSFAGNATGSNPAINMLAGSAGGGYLNANPYLDNQYNAASNALTRSFRDATMPGIQGGFARAGRFGSGMQVAQEEAAQRALGESLGDLGANMYGQNYAQERQNQLAAQNSIGGLYQGGQGLQLNALNALSGRDLQGAGINLQAANVADQAYNADRNRQFQGLQAAAQQQLGAGQQIYTNQLQGIGMAPTIAAADYADASALLGTGQQQESYLNAANEAPWAHLARLQGAVSGNYGGTATTTKPSSSSPLGMIGGLGLLAASMFTGGATAPAGLSLLASSAGR